MKKTLTLTKGSENYLIKAWELVLITFSIDKKTILGNDIFDKIYKDLPKGETADITISGDSSIKEKDDLTILSRLQELFQDIDKSISSTLNLAKETPVQ